MLNQLKDVQRRVIPRWRTLSETPNAETTLNSGRRIEVVKSSFVLEVEKRWSDDPTLENAFELVAASSLFGHTDTSRIAAATLAISSLVVPSVSELSRKHLAFPTLVSAEAPELSANEEIYRRLSEIKKALQENPRNTIMLVEAARLYANLGQNKAAERCFERALAAGENNRFIMRSAARFFVHGQDPDRARRVFKDISTGDPWLLSAAISCADLVGQRDRRIRIATNLLESFSPDQVTELAASLATIEMQDGSTKKAKRLFAQSMISPNDNSVAQIRWAGKELQLPFDEKLLNVERTFEARFHQSVHEKKLEGGSSPCFQLDE